MSAGIGEGGQNLPTGTITFLLTDIEGSTRRWGEFKSLMEQVVEQHDGILVSAFEAHGGIDLKKKGEGDSRFAVFTSARQAVSSAIQMQHDLAKHDWGKVGQIKVRVALHSGEAQLRNGDYYGTVVNRCARMRGAAHGGQIILSEAAKELLGGQLPEGVTLRDLGLHRFKDLEEADRIYQVTADDLEDVRTPLNSLSAAKHNLPVQLSTFIGRSDVLAEIRKLVGPSRLVTLFGVGGGGKTRLALQVAAELTDQFADGVWFVDLAPLHDPELITQVIAQSLPISQAGQAPMDAIIDAYSERRALLVIDNCEHLLPKAAVVVNEILRRCPSIKVLATSRQPLSVQGECVFDVPPMNFDLHGLSPTKEIVGQLESVELLRDRAAKRLSGEDILTKETAEDIYLLCKQLDGIPLAIEQVAAGLAYMTVRQVRTQLAEHFKMKKFDPVGVPDRQQTMEAAIEWSVRLLTDAEKKLFLLLSVFDGGCTSGAAEFVCSENMSGSSEIVQILERLASGSLLSYRRSASRYRMLEPIRQFAAERLPAPDLQGLRDRHFEWFYNIALQAKAAGLEADDSRHYKALNADYDNLRRALAWGLTRQEFAIKTVELCNALYRFWLRRGLIREGTTWIQQSMDTTPDIPEEVRAEALLWLGVLQWQGKNYGAAEQALQSSYEIFTALHDEQNAARAFGNLGLIAFAQCHYAIAKKRFEQVIPVFEKFGNMVALTATTENLGVCQSELGDLERAEETLRRAVSLHREMKSTSGLAKALDALLGNYEKMGQLLNHKDEFSEGAEITLNEDEIFLIENCLELGCLFCKHLGEYELGAQAMGGLEMAAEESQRVLVPAQESLREDLRSFFTAQLGEKRYRRAVLDGRGLGARTMLRMVCRRVEGEG